MHEVRDYVMHIVESHLGQYFLLKSLYMLIFIQNNLLFQKTRPMSVCWNHVKQFGAAMKPYFRTLIYFTEVLLPMQYITVCFYSIVVHAVLCCMQYITVCFIQYHSCSTLLCILCIFVCAVHHWMLNTVSFMNLTCFSGKIKWKLWNLNYVHCTCFIKSCQLYS